MIPIRGGLPEHLPAVGERFPGRGKRSLERSLQRVELVFDHRELDLGGVAVGEGPFDLGRPQHARAIGPEERQHVALELALARAETAHQIEDERLGDMRNRAGEQARNPRIAFALVDDAVAIQVFVAVVDAIAVRIPFERIGPRSPLDFIGDRVPIRVEDGRGEGRGRRHGADGRKEKGQEEHPGENADGRAPFGAARGCERAEMRSVGQRKTPVVARLGPQHRSRGRIRRVQPEMKGVDTPGPEPVLCGIRRIALDPVTPTAIAAHVRPGPRALVAAHRM